MEFSRERRRVQIKCGGGSRTRQSEKDSTDIQKILRRFIKNGERIPVPGANEFADVSGLGTYFDNQARLVAGREAYESLPREIREKWSPQELLGMVATDQGMAVVAQAIEALRKPPVEKPGDKVDNSEKPPVKPPLEAEKPK